MEKRMVIVFAGYRIGKCSALIELIELMYSVDDTADNVSCKPFIPYDFLFQAEFYCGGNIRDEILAKKKKTHKG